jgi:hypothetical protein
VNQSLGVGRSQTLGDLSADLQDIWHIEWAGSVEPLLE